jgi:hypothetical protein
MKSLREEREHLMALYRKDQEARALSRTCALVTAHGAHPPQFGSTSLDALLESPLERVMELSARLGKLIKLQRCAGLLGFPEARSGAAAHAAGR